MSSSYTITEMHKEIKIGCMNYLLLIRYPSAEITITKAITNDFVCAQYHTNLPDIKV